MAIPFRLPTFIAPVSIWRFSNWAGTIPPTNLPDVTALGNLTPGRRVYGQGMSPTSYVLLPVGTDVRYSEDRLWTTWPPPDPDLIEVPTGSGLYYVVSDVERVGLGFANEHVEAALTKQPAMVTPPPPPVFEFLSGNLGGNPTATAGTEITIFPSTYPAGTLVVVALAMDSPLTGGITDDGGNFYNLANNIDNGSDCYIFLLWSVLTNPASQLEIIILGSCAYTVGFSAFSGSLTGTSVSSQNTGTNTGTAVPWGVTVPTGTDLQIVAVATNQSADEDFDMVPPFDGPILAWGDPNFGQPSMMFAVQVDDPLGTAGNVNLSVSADWVLAWATFTP